MAEDCLLIHDVIARAMADLATSQTQDTLETLAYTYTSRFQACTVSLRGKSRSAAEPQGDNPSVVQNPWCSCRSSGSFRNNALARETLNRQFME